MPLMTPMRANIVGPGEFLADEWVYGAWAELSKAQPATVGNRPSPTLKPNLMGTADC